MYVPQGYTNYISNSGLLNVDLLSEPPASTDMNLWKFIQWNGYSSRQSELEVLNDLSPYGKVGIISSMWQPGNDAYQIKAVGVSRNGVCLGVFPVDKENPILVGGGIWFQVNVQLVFNNVIPTK